MLNSSLPVLFLRLAKYYGTTLQKRAHFRLLDEHRRRLGFRRTGPFLEDAGRKRVGVGRSRQSKQFPAFLRAAEQNGPKKASDGRGRVAASV